MIAPHQVAAAATGALLWPGSVARQAPRWILETLLNLLLEGLGRLCFLMYFPPCVFPLSWLHDLSILESYPKVWQESPAPAKTPAKTPATPTPPQPAAPAAPAAVPTAPVEPGKAPATPPAESKKVVQRTVNIDQEQMGLRMGHGPPSYDIYWPCVSMCAYQKWEDGGQPVDLGERYFMIFQTNTDISMYFSDPPGNNPYRVQELGLPK